jgi:hypothetical protein
LKTKLISNILIGDKNMKNQKWLNYAISIFLTLVVLTAVAGAGFRAGMTQNVAFARARNGTHPSFAHNDFGGTRQAMQGNFNNNDKNQTMQNNAQKQAFNNDRGLSFRSPVFGLIQLAVLGLLAWVGYKFVKKSGWKLSLVKTSPTPSASEVPSVKVEEEKTSE